MQPDIATLRERLARACGLIAMNAARTEWRCTRTHYRYDFTSLDGLAALWRDVAGVKGWEWWRFRLDDGNLIWEAINLETKQRETLFDTGDPIYDATHLLTLVAERIAGKAVET